MKFHETVLDGAYTIELDKVEDSRGYFARLWCQKEFEAHGLVASIAQASTSFNRKAGTLRGMHYQLEPHQETKVVRCTAGAIYDVIVDLRPDSPTYREWTGVELMPSDGALLYIPAEFAHGFITLKDNTEVSYLMSEFYQPGAARGFRWNDPKFGIKWPVTVHEISDKDASWPDFSS